MVIVFVFFVATLQRSAVMSGARRTVQSVMTKKTQNVTTIMCHLTQEAIIRPDACNFIRSAGQTSLSKLGQTITPRDV
jgi:hypothetical protein